MLSWRRGSERIGGRVVTVGEGGDVDDPDGTYANWFAPPRTSPPCNVPTSTSTAPLPPAKVPPRSLRGCVLTSRSMTRLG